MNGKRKIPDSPRESGDEKEAFPEWLSKLVKEDISKMNFFCLDCCIPFCVARNHELHKSMKIYPYGKRNSVKLDVLDEYFDCDGVQKYKQDNKNLVHITSSMIACKIEMLQNYANQCRNLNCCKNLRGGVYCSLGCKVERCKSSIKDLIKYWGSSRGERVETSATKNLNATSTESCGSCN